MLALQYAQHGGPEVLEVAEAPAPHPGPGQVRIAVRAASVNPLDWKIRSGDDGPLPGFAGFDGAGVIDEVGEGVSEVALGLEVFGLGTNTVAEHAVLRLYAAKPVQMSWEEAAAVGVAGETAHRVLGLLGIGPGQTVLVDGGSGGVGVFAVQLAAARGASVIATASEHNHAFLRSLGATPVTYGDGLADRVRAVAPAGLDGVFDAVGKTPIEVLVDLVPEPTQVVSIANFTAADSGARVSEGGEGDPAAALDEISTLYVAGRLQIPIQQTFPFTEAAEAHRLSQAGHVRGKLVLTLPIR